ncbi:MAG TPA: sorbosone dehydrogenase family protein [Candidatus Sulfotelmatobacter sp.]|nr:sorbosone dehydrogenase family protein [Candidatus Sulfotelmatobacter sp.]
MDLTGRRLGLRIAGLGILCAAPGILLGQVTHGNKPQLPAPFATKSAGNPPEEAKPPKGFLPTVPAGFKIDIFATDFNEPRWLTVAPNGKDIFLADTHGNKIYILRMPANGNGEGQKEEFLSGLDEPFGIAFHDDYIYVGDTDAVLRYKFDPMGSKKLGDAEKIMDLPRRGHSTRAVAFSADGKHLFVSVGSQSNVDIESDTRRAAVTICDPDGKNARLYATGLRNPVGIAIEPKTGVLFTSVNERDGLGDDLPPDYFTSVKDGGFYGWPYSYIGKNVDPRVNPQKPELVAKAIIPDVLLGAHRAPLQFAFYTGKQFPAKYDGGVFLCEHGSWNRSQRAGYQVVFIPFKNGQPAGDPEPFMTGLVPDPSKGNVNGRPVGVTVAPDGSLLVSDDGAQVVYRISAAR